MNKPSGRVSPCDKADAKDRLRRAESFLYVADLTLGERVDTPLDHDAINLSGVAAALAVLAGIAASDAACCHNLGRRPRSQDHKQAVDLVRQVIPHGEALANDLDRLLDLKDNAHYGVLGVADGEAKKAVDQARRMVDHAKRVLSA
jgi:hypothetical protein